VSAGIDAFSLPEDFLMKNLTRSYLIVIAIVFATFTGSGKSLAEDSILIIHAEDAEDEPVKGVVFSNKGDGTQSAPTDRAGTTRLALPKAAYPNDWIHLQVLKGTEGSNNWIFLSPWDGRVAVPPFDNKPDRFVLVVVAQKFDKRLLANPVALRAMTATANSELAPKTAGETITEEQRRAVLVEVAKSYGLGADEIDKAIRAWGAKSKDPYEIGLTALYARNYPLATEQLSKSLEIKESELEQKKAEVADSAFFLGQSLYAQGRYGESANAYRKAAAQRPDDANVMNNLALSLTQAGSYADAEPLLKRALAIIEKALGPNHSDVATILNNLALLYDNQGKYAEAEPLYKRSLEIDEKALGPNHSDVAQSLNNLAGLYYSQGKYADAEPLLKRALAINQKVLGADHPDVATGLNNLALLYDHQGKYADAESLYQRSLAIREKVLGIDHPDVARSLHNLALLYDNQGKYADAEPLYKRALAI
jgi:tetratricopeptide (TPR) repeat protein